MILNWQAEATRLCSCPFQVQLEGREVVIHRASIHLGLAEPARAIGQEADLVAVGGRNLPNEADVVAQRASNRDSSLGMHFVERIE